MNTNFFRGKKITVFGLGLLGGGIGVVKFLLKHGARVVITDIKTKKELSSSIEKLKGYKDIEYVLGHHRAEDFTNVDMVIKNPNVPWTNQYIKMAISKNVPVEMDSSLFFKLCHNPIIGVTGTKGKTTTSTMIYELLKLSGKDPVKVGISRTSVLDQLDLIKKDSVVVFELSSWRLSALGRSKISPNISVFTNIHPDHLNYYESMEEYVEDKKNIFKFQSPKGWFVYNHDDENVKKISEEAGSQLIGISSKPLYEGYSVFIEDEKIYLNNGIDYKLIVSKDNLNIVGEHNIQNIMMAIGAVYAFGVGIEEIKKSVPLLKGVEDRLEFVRELRGVKYYNDTAATIPEASVNALRTFNKNVILIAGGSDKNLDFSKFSETIIKKAKGLILLKGDATDKLAKLIKESLAKEGADQKLEIVDSMDKAVEKASIFAESGDIVLLSPGAASFGLFANEFDRGEKFKNSVRKLS